LEKFIGFVRMDSDDINISKEMTSTIAQTDTVKEAKRVLEREDSVPRRVNLAGVHVDDSTVAVAKICLKARHTHEGALSSEEQVAFLQFREYLSLLKMAADMSRSRNEMNWPFAYSSGSWIVCLINAHPVPQPDMNE
jgi:hypothetical protein